MKIKIVFVYMKNTWKKGDKQRSDLGKGKRRKVAKDIINRSHSKGGLEIPDMQQMKDKSS